MNIFPPTRITLEPFTNTKKKSSEILLPRVLPHWEKYFKSAQSNAFSKRYYILAFIWLEISNLKNCDFQGNKYDDKFILHCSCANNTFCHFQTTHLLVWCYLIDLQSSQSSILVPVYKSVLYHFKITKLYDRIFM